VRSFVEARIAYALLRSGRNETTFVSQQLRNKVGGRSDFLHREEIFVFSVNGNRDSRAQSVEIEL
jgi:hypothetical protein